MRRAGKSVKHRKWLVLSAAALAAAVGCAQIVGIEEWRPYLACEEQNVDPDTCKPLTCSECLYSLPSLCESQRADCFDDQKSVCSTVFTCAAPCEKASDTASCVSSCCSGSQGDAGQGGGGAVDMKVRRIPVMPVQCVQRQVRGRDTELRYPLRSLGGRLRRPPRGGFVNQGQGREAQTSSSRLPRIAIRLDSQGS
jgi:hypothetical protein